MTRFSVSNLSVFERHGATVDRCGGRHGCWVNLPNGWTLSVQWGAGNYGSNRDASFYADSLPDAVTAEIAAWKNDGSMVTWKDGDTVQGWCSMERVQHILDLLAEDKLVRKVAPVADDQWSEVTA